MLSDCTVFKLKTNKRDTSRKSVFGIFIEILLKIYRSKTKILGRWQHSELFVNENAAGMTMPNMGYNPSRL